MNSSIRNQYTIFGDINTRQNGALFLFKIKKYLFILEILRNDYVYKTLYEVDFKKCLRSNLVSKYN